MTGRTERDRGVIIAEIAAWMRDATQCLDNHIAGARAAACVRAADAGLIDAIATAEGIGIASYSHWGMHS